MLEKRREQTGRGEVGSKMLRMTLSNPNAGRVALEMEVQKDEEEPRDEKDQSCEGNLVRRPSRARQCKGDSNRQPTKDDRRECQSTAKTAVVEEGGKEARARGGEVGR